MNSKKTLQTLLVGAMAVGVMGAADASAGAGSSKGKEKCYGVAKAGHNDCGAADKSHACAGLAKKDGDVNEWLLVPTGLCDKLAHGTTTPGGEK